MIWLADAQVYCRPGACVYQQVLPTLPSQPLRSAAPQPSRSHLLEMGSTYFKSEGFSGADYEGSLPLSF